MTLGIEPIQLKIIEYLLLLNINQSSKIAGNTS